MTRTTKRRRAISDIEAPSRWGLWQTLLWSVLIALVFFAAQAVTFGALAVQQIQDLRAGPELTQRLRAIAATGTVISWTTLASGLACTGAILGIIKLRGRSAVSEYLEIKATSIRGVLIWLLALSGLIAISDIVSVQLGRPIVPEFARMAYATADPRLLLWLAFVVIAPIAEEVFFRGFLFVAVESSFIKQTGAIVLTAILWTMLHIQYDALILASVFCTGILFGAARVNTRSMLTPIALHMFANLVATVQAAFLTV